MGFPGSSADKESACNAGDPGSIPGFGSSPGEWIGYQLQELAQTHVHQVSDTIQPSQPLLSPSPPAFNLSQHQGLIPMSWLFASGGQSIGASASA